MSWVDEWDARRLVDRSERTLRLWRAQGLVRAVRRADGWWYEARSLVWARDESRRRYEGRRCRAGWGRGHKRSLPGECLVLFV